MKYTLVFTPPLYHKLEVGKVIRRDVRAEEELGGKISYHSVHCKVEEEKRICFAVPAFNCISWSPQEVTA